MAKQSRRKFIYKILGFLGITVLAAWIFRRPIIKYLMKGDFDTSLLNAAPTTAEDLCVLTSTQGEGPFFFPSPERQNVKEDRNGKDLNLKFQVLRQPDCTPISNAIVDIWHCDAEGVYSGYPEEITHDVWKEAVFMVKNGEKVNGELHIDPINDNRFLRGRQRTDANGWVTFNTIVPGWYDGRVPHIHAKIIVDEKEQLSTQFYLEKDFCDTLYTRTEPYDKFGKCPLEFKNDIVLSGYDSANGLLLKVTGNSNESVPLNAVAKIGVQKG